MNTIKVNENNGNLGDLTNAIDSANNILKNVLDDLISKSQKLQKDGDFEQAVTLIEIQKGVHKSLNENLSLIETLPKRKQSRKPVRRTKTPRKRQLSDDYNDYEVDTSEPHNITEDFRFKRPHAFEVNGSYQEAGTWKEMLVETCRVLNSFDSKKFASFAEEKSMHWGDTFNFSKDKEVIREPVLIGDSGVYVETAKGAIGARQLIIKMLDMFGIDVNEYKVYLRADYSPKRENDDNYRRRQQ